MLSNFALLRACHSFYPTHSFLGARHLHLPLKLRHAKTPLFAMHASTAAWLLLLGVATAMPALQARAPDVTDPWVTVGDDGRPKTVTPVQTTIDGTPTVISAAPNAVTATVFTNTNHGDVRTTTATVPNPTPTATGGAGAFPVCHNKDGDNAPFCLPVVGAELNPGRTYYS